MNRIALIIVLLASVSMTWAAKKNEVASPNGRIKVVFNATKAGMNYAVSVDGKALIAQSKLGLVGDKQSALDAGFAIKKVAYSSVDSVWTQPWGENKSIRENYNEMAISLQNAKKVKLTVRFRAFNDGIGFRYEYAVAGADSVKVMDENTEFVMAADGTSWSIPASSETYELTYRTMPLSEVETANTPISFKQGAIYGSIHEAALTDFPEMTLKQADGDLHFKAELAPWPDGVKARFAGGEFKTPWRTIQIADAAVGLINSSLILNLNEPCALATTDWIKPMKYVGVWWGMHLGIESWVINDRHGATTENAKRYIDFAAANNIEGVLFEGWNEGWESWGGRQNFDYTRPYADFDIKEIMRYAKHKGIEVIGHHETGGNIPNYERQLDRCYKWSADLGIHNMKTGYAGGLPGGHNHHGQFNVRHYRKVVQTAAKYHITIDAHEPIKDTGIRRTYPNMMTREGARGMEWNAWSDGNMPEHTVMIPFTRLLSGPMDYTPGVFDILYEKAKNSPDRKQWNQKDSKDCRISSTLARQVANWVIIYSPLQMASDLIESYEGHPAFQFFRDFNADCDWSKALAGEPGEFVAVVRRAGNKFYLGAATNDQARELNIKLDFLEAGKQYRAIIYADGADADWRTNPLSYVISEKRVTSADTLSVKMASGGGQAIYFKPVE